MFVFRTALLAAQEVASCEREALERYLDEHAGHHERQTYLQTDVKEVHTNVLRRPQGNITVTVSILARQPWNSDTYFFRLQSKGNCVSRVEPVGSR